MFDQIISYSVRNKFVIGIGVIALIIWGIFSLRQIPIDAVPDITNNQVQIITNSPTLATQEIEQFITTPIELSLQNLQDIVEIRSISRFGLSVITVVFEESHDVYLARQLVGEQLKLAQNNIPEGLGSPELAPISTGLGEIYQYVVKAKEGYEDKYTSIELRTIQDWIVKRQMTGIPGVAEVNSMGGYVKQYEVAIDPELLNSMNLTINDIYDALEMSNENTGGAYIEKKSNTYYIRAEGLVKNLEDIENIVVTRSGDVPILIRDIATVKIGKAPRYGALVMNGEEAVGGKVMMFKGANSSKVTKRVKERVEQIQKSLPEGVEIQPYLVRDKLVRTAISTVKKNLLEGGLIVIFILVLLLGNWRAGLIVASVIPLSMMFAISMMNLFGISANLMSLGAIDFGLIVDGAVIIAEAIVHRLHFRFRGKQLTQSEMDEEVIDSSQKIRSSAAFGEIIILMVYIPILALVGIEGKMFKPMAQTVMLAIGGALILSLTYVPMMASLFLKKRIDTKVTFSDRLINGIYRLYKPSLELAMRFKVLVVTIAIALFIWSFVLFNRMGGEFIPTLEEGDLAMQHIIPPGSSLQQSVKTASMVQNKLRAEFPEVLDVVTNIGSAEIPTDPMPVEIGDYTIIMKPKKEWESAHSRKEMFREFEKAVQDFPGVNYEFSQPIQLRFNELMTGTKADIAIKLYGEDLDLLYSKAKETESVIRTISGVGTVNIEQTLGMPQIIVSYDYKKMAQYGLHVREVNRLIKSAFAGGNAGIVYEGERRFDLIVRLAEEKRTNIEDVRNLYIDTPTGSRVPLKTVANVELKNAPMQISRDNTNRRIVIGVNVGDTDVETLVNTIQSKLDEELDLPSGYYFSYGGQFENLRAANQRLMIAVPIALALIFIMLYFTFGSVLQSLLIFTAIPLSAIGGVLSLYLRDMPFSISAGIGFIALFGVAVLNGIVLIGYFNQLKKEGMSSIKQRIIEGTKVRLRPVLMTAAVASLGFLPMAISTSGGAEVQRPLATVVIGGLITATFLTLVILPILYYWLESWSQRNQRFRSNASIIVVVLFCGFSGLQAQNAITLDEAISIGVENHPGIQSYQLQIDQFKSLQYLGYNPGKTEVSYVGAGLFRDNPNLMNEIAIGQNFPSPSVVKSQNAWNRELTSSAEISYKEAVAAFTKDIRKLYIQLQFTKAIRNLHDSMYQEYTKFYKIADSRAQYGEGSRLEKLLLQVLANECKLLLEQNEIEIEELEQNLQLLIGETSGVTSQGPFEPLNISEIANQRNLRVIQAEAQKSILQQKVKMLEAELKPTYRVSYGLQHYLEGGWLHGFQAGVALPLFSKNSRVGINAQLQKVGIADSRIELAQLTFDKQKREILSKMERHEKGFLFYQKQANEVVFELQSIAQKQYEAGQIDYIELLPAVELQIQTQKAYYQQVLQYNFAAADYYFLLFQ